MSCPDWAERIAEQIGGAFSADIREHLASCPDCAALAEELERDRLAIAAAPPEAASADYAAMRRGIRAAIARERRVRRYVPAALAAAAVLAGIVIIHREERPQARPVAAARETVVERPRTPEIPAAPAPTPQRVPRPQQPTLDLALMQKVTGIETPQDAGSQSPVEMRIDTANPNVTIILLQEKEGSYE